MQSLLYQQLLQQKPALLLTRSDMKMKKFAIISAIVTGIVAGSVYLAPAAEAGLDLN